METKSVRLDLRCEGDDGTRFIVEMQQSGTRFIVEMQQSGQRHFFKRCGPEWTGRYISEYTFREKQTGEVPDESISLRFVELDRFVKPLDECVGLKENHLPSK